MDIENSYLVGGMWGIWNQTISLPQLFEHGKVVCYAARWRGTKEMMFGRYDEPDFLQKIWNLMDEADVILTFNGKRHDIPMLNREFVKAGMGPPSPSKQLDLFPTVKSVFKFPSNKLQHVANELGIGQKLDHEGFPLWVKVVQGDEKAWAKMERYNKQDVRLLDKLYDKLQPWVANHPNYNLFGRVGVCPHCGGTHYQKRGTYKTQTGIYERFHCQKCKTWFRGRFTQVARENAAQVYTGVAL